MRERNATLVRRALENASETNRERVVSAFCAQVPDRYLRFSIQEDYLGADSIIESKSLVSLRRALEDEPTFTIIRGPKGTGKTTLAVSLTKHWLSTFDLDAPPDHGTLNARLTTFTGLLDDLSFNREIMGELASTYILVIDDIGAGADTVSDHQAKQLTDLIENRWSRDLPTILTTNMPISTNREGRGVSDMFAPQSWDRISDGLVLISLEGESHRGSVEA